MEKEKPVKLKAYYILYNVSVISVIIIVFIVGLTSDFFTASITHLLNTSIGLLAFLGIFYSLIIRKDTKIRIKQLNEKINLEIKEAIKQASLLMDKTSDTRISSIMLKISNRIAYYENLKVIIKPDFLMATATIMFFITLVFRIYFANYLIPVQFMTFTLGLIFTILLVILWIFILKVTDLEEEQIAPPLRI